MNPPDRWTPTSVQDTIASVHETPARRDAAYAPTVDTFSEPCEAGESSREWHPAPGWSASPWDMLDFDARDLYVLLGRITKTYTDMSLRMVDAQKASPPKRLVIRPEQGNGLIKTILEPLEKHCQELALDSAQDQIESIRRFLANEGSCSECVKLFADLYSRIIGQLKRRSFFHLPADKTSYYKAAQLLGPEVDAKFPDAREDIVEAGRSFATDRFTACVFHLMRVMERAVQSFAGKLGLSDRAIHFKLREWGRILGAVKKKIETLPQKTHRSKRKKEAYSEAWAFLDRVREAWRNKTMHPKARAHCGFA
jgi:hypothetical protein